MTSAELKVEGLNARVTECKEERRVNDQQLERLKASIGRIRRTPEFQTVRQFVVAEGSEEHPDYSGLRRLIIETFARGLDLEIEAVREKRRRETA
jgi:hypothetical protein